MGEQTVTRQGYNHLMNRFLRIALCVALLLGLHLASPQDASARAPQRARPSTAYDLIEAVNALRAARGLPPYSVHPILMQIAQAQANYMAATGTITHYGPDGSRPFQRALAAGYPVAGDLSLGGWFSENIMGGPNLTAEDVVEAWMGDAPHQNTMLSSTLQDIGAGVAVSGNYYYYIIDCGLASGSKVSYTPGATTAPGGTPALPEATIPVAIVSTPDEKGDVYHVVQPGQTLWQIAVAYKTTVNAIKEINRLSSNDIYPNQKLLIRRVGTATPPPPTAIPRRDSATATPLPTLAIYTATATPTVTATPMAAVPVPLLARGTAVAIIALVALIAAGLFAWAGRSRPV